MRLQVLQQSTGPLPQRLPGVPGQQPGHDRTAGRRTGRPLVPGGLQLGRLLQDHVRVRAAHPEARDTGPARTAVGGPLARLGEQFHGPGRPVDVRGRLVDVQGPRQQSVPHRLHHLDHTADTGRGLGVTDVRLQRSQPQRPLRRPVLAVGGDHRLRLDRIAERGPRPVRLHGVHVGGGEPGVRERLPDHALLGRSVGGGEAVAGAVLVGRGAADQGEHRMAVAAGVGEALHEQQPHALTERGAVGGRGERLAAAVAGESALPAEADEDVRVGQHGRSAGEREVALAEAQRLHGEVQGDQRGRAGGVHGHRRSLQAQRVGDPAGGDAARAAEAEVALHVGGQLHP